MTHRSPSFSCESFQATRVSRRHVLKVGGLGMLGMTMPGLLQAAATNKDKGPKARAKSVIFLFQYGGPSHLDMFDMKPNAPEQIRGPHQPISSSADGIQVSERLPRVSRVMDKVTLIRSMLQSPKLRAAFDLGAEPAKVRDAYGRTTYGQGCLLARRLVEAGSKFVTVYFSESIGGQSTESGGWDTHGFNNTRMYPIIEKYHLPITEQTLPTLLNDLEDRGLLDETLVVWMGEFGRTPRINDNASRDHWPQCYTTLLAGGGVKRGFVYGASDKTGSHPAENPVSPDDLAATVFHLLGIDPHTEVHGVGNRPVPISEGKAVTAVIA